LSNPPATTVEFAGPVWLAADMHLGPEGPATREAFLAFLEAAASEASALMLLGDIFDAWVGDDALLAPPDWLAEVVAGLSAVAAKIPVYLSAGNRDFLMGDALAQATGTRRLADPAMLRTDGGSFLLSHGDALCTDDVAYQQFRVMVRDPQWQAQFLAQPLPARQAIAQQLRERSVMEKSRKAADIMDVNQAAVEAVLREHGAARLVHGHTHRPGRHVFEMDGKPCERLVLPDWDLDDAENPRGGWVTIDRDGPVYSDIGLE
jgi:UDP-2,3-diacylglucosamine hydrolase